MQLDFNILWIEDNVKWRENSIEKISDCVLGCGFFPIVHAYDNGQFMYNENCDIGKYDIIFMDYNLNDKKDSKFNTGDEIIKKIRAEKIYSNIIFYSSADNDLPEKVKENDIQNTYIFDRESFQDENIDSIKEVIEYILNRANSINIMRGILMAELANFDNIILDIIDRVELEHKWDKIFDLITKSRQRSCYNIIENNNELKEKKEQFKEVCNIVRSKNDIEEIKKQIFDEDKSSAIFSSSLRKDFLNTILNEKNIILSGNNDFKENYLEEIIRKRNKLGHCKTIEDCSNEDFLTIRKNILKHRKNIEEIKTKLAIS